MMFLTSPGQGTSPRLGFDSLRMASFIAIPMPEKLHSSVVPYPNTHTEPSTWAVFVTAPSCWSNVTGMVKKFSCVCACCDASDPRTHIM